MQSFELNFIIRGTLLFKYLSGEITECPPRDQWCYLLEGMYE